MEYSCEFRDVLIGFTKGSREVQRRLLSVRLYPLFIDTSLSTGFQVYLSKCWVPRMFTKALRYDSLEFLFNCSVNLMLSFVVVVSLFSFVLLNHNLKKKWLCCPVNVYHEYLVQGGIDQIGLFL